MLKKSSNITELLARVLLKDICVIMFIFADLRLAHFSSGTGDCV